MIIFLLPFKKDKGNDFACSYYTLTRAAESRDSGKNFLRHK